MSKAEFSSTWLAVATSPTLQPALVNGTHGAGVTVVGETVVDDVAGGTGEYTMFGLVSWPAFGGRAVSSTGSVQYVNAVAGSAVPSGLKAWKLLLNAWPCRSPYRPVAVVSRSGAVCAMSGVWLFDSMTPFPSMKLRRLGMSSRSDGTLGL